MKVELIDSMGSDLSVVNAARVSFEKASQWETTEIRSTRKTLYTPPLNSRDWDYGPQEIDVPYVTTVKGLSEKDQKLIQYLAKHKHKSPFNHCFASFRVKAPIFVARQLVKHEYLPWNEVSRRYVDSEPDFYEPKVWRAKAENKKQGSNEELEVKELVVVSGTLVGGLKVRHAYQSHIDRSLDLYNVMLQSGVCPEQARIVLPLSMMTEWIWSGSLFAFAKMAKLRLDPHTQKESREVAELISKEMEQTFPHSWKALLEHYDGD